MAKSILVQGFYGERNLGDDYILYSILSSISKSSITDVCVLGSGGDSYEELKKIFPQLGISVKRNASLSRTERLMIGSKYSHWLIGGGGLFPAESRKEALQYLLRIIWAKLHGTKVAIYGVEYNSFNDSVYALIWKWALKLCDHVIVRNHTNETLLKKIGVKKAKESSDVTFSLVTDVEQADKSTVSEQLVGVNQEYLVWAISTPWMNREFENLSIKKHIEDRYAILCRLIAKTMDSYPEFTHVFLPFYDNMDLRIAHDIKKIVKSQLVVFDEENVISIVDKRYLFKNARAAICMRFHSVLFSLYFGTPFAAISYSPKTSSVLEENGLADNMVLYGVRDTQYFYKEFEIDESEFKELVDRTIRVGKRTDVVSERLKTYAKEAEKTIVDWMNK